MNGSTYFTTATALTMVALLGFMAAGFFPVIVDFAFAIEAVAVILALTGLVMVAFVTVRKSLERAARLY
ncbi:MAG: hypothetical protein ACTMKZ_11145 [Brevibacterium aurantiacum]|uniref:Uncharacterized protein n=3 Tax=Brevibacterium TaxID=1696 RepID=A0A1D7W3E5_BREAU|nr:MULTISPECIES: hypothetical protein [Brevibacterium]AOP53480.1 hypothetical protein BLSMQ_1770 [Brevibacterium aurantiacum]AZL05673.1 hypothetical protein CXR24_08800 [Brevibacterium aurantiacum]AZL09261.1 hypothetical protein CXR26_08500 [Brevibacterium aurantiacum]AZL12886.1 hypothetical protein CXR25_08740 [Brevibacterium aurantiacum]AZT93350.1 hypothetical protein CXR23_09500 [Brevibacterium aurantiacum]